MICPQCKKEDKKSKVYPGVGYTTCMYYPPFYDEEGNYHHHDGNAITTEYTCSDGHKWVEKYSGSCWCGWGKEGEKKIKKEYSISIENSKYLCPKCGVVEWYIEISIPPFEGKYCQRCYAQWIRNTFPKVTRIKK